MSVKSRDSVREPVWLVDPKRSPVGFWLISTFGLVLLAGAVALGLQIGSDAELALAAILVTGGFLFLSVAIVLGAARGGAAFFPHEQVVRLFGRSSDDALAVPLSELIAISVIRRSETWGREDAPVLVSSVELTTQAGPTLHLLEFGSLEDAREAALMFRTVLKLPVVEPPDDEHQEGGPGESPSADAGECGPGPCGDISRSDRPAGAGQSVPQASRDSSDVRPPVVEAVSIGPGWGLGIAILPAALFCVLSGALLLAGVESTGVLGFLFGPVALFAGVGLGLLWLYKASGSEEIVRTGAAVEQTHRWGPFRWGRNRLAFSPTELRCRIRSRGPNGLCIEALAGQHLLILAAGSGIGTRMPPEKLFELARRLGGT
ncbi:MAG: hypothetical protein FJ109_08180 [Deltaproteobacteria bacterium]|nr:hypothetical protein [Deltaproteobacteria bacterium]